MISNLDSNIMQLRKTPQFQLICWHGNFVETSGKISVFCVVIQPLKGPFDAYFGEK